MSGCEDQSPTSGKIQRKLSLAIPFEWMGITSNQISDPCSRFQCYQPYLQLTCRGRPEFLLGDGLFFAQIANFLVLVSNFQGNPIL